MAQHVNWFVEQRRAWIVEMLQIYGFINRSHVVAKFRCSAQSAGHDLTAVQEQNADWIKYEPRRKAYINTQL